MSLLFGCIPLPSRRRQELEQQVIPINTSYTNEWDLIECLDSFAKDNYTIEVSIAPGPNQKHGNYAIKADRVETDPFTT